LASIEEEEDDDGMDEIDTSNIVAGRTRGKNINWAEADQKAKEAGDDLDDDDDEDDEDFEEQESKDRDAMEE
jgi:Histone chaperone domain CHZ